MEAPPYSLTDVQENQTLTSQRTACIKLLHHSPTWSYHYDRNDFKNLQF